MPTISEVTIKTTLDKVIVKKVGAAKKNTQGHIYLPPEWIGKTVQVILME